MKYTAISITFFTVFSLCNFAHALKPLKINDGQYVTYDASFLAGSSASTLIFLPGINRALDNRDAFIQQLKHQKKFNFVSYHTSLHPESLALIPTTQTAYFKLKDVTAQDLADEATTLVEKLKIKNPIFISLSYSSVIANKLAQMNTESIIIEVAPMIRFDEADPEGSQTLSFWKNWFNLFPGVGSIWTKSLLHQAYSHYWSQRVEELAQEDEKYQDPAYKALVVQGYTQLSIAADGFDYRQQELANSAKRYFILADNEEENRAKLQYELIEKYNSATEQETSPYIIKDSGHIIPSEQPKQYLSILRQILKIEGLIN